MRSKGPPIAKITRPGADGIFVRRRLFRLIDKGLGFPITWVTGPPGSGKTALIASYIESGRWPSLWYQIDERDADIASFFYYMGLAAKKASPQKRKPMPLLTSEYSAGIPAFTRRYFEEFYLRLNPSNFSGRNPSAHSLGRGNPRPIPSGKKGFVVVFDDYQNVPLHSGFHEMIAHGLDMIPEGVHVFILSRNEAPPHLSRLRANHKISFLGWDEIRFTLEESKEMVRTEGQGKISKEILLKLHKETEGWAAGLVLILLGSRLGKMDYQLTRRFPTKEIYDYFAAEIFEKVEKETQKFLVVTAVLPRMTVRMAERLTGISDSKQLLTQLSENHYFTEKYLENDPDYQYHPLFREFLLSRMESLFRSDEIRSIRREAALLLEESGRLEEAAALFRDAGDCDGLIRLITSQAQSLLSQGRNKILEEWIGTLPKDVREKRPWLLYWLGLCKQPFNPAESRAHFEQAFQLFQGEKDIPGAFLAWSAAVDTIVFEWNDFTLLDHWIKWLDERLLRDPSFPSPEIEARVASSMTGALLYRQPYHPDIRKWIERSLSLCREIDNTNLQMQAYLYAVNYYAWIGDLANCSIMAEEIRKTARSMTASPLLVLTWKWIEALIYNRTTGSWEMALKSVSDGLEVAEKNGVHVWDQMLFSQAVYASLNKGDMAMAGEFLKKMEATLEKGRRHSLCQYHYLEAWYHLLIGDSSRASLSAGTALRLADETGMYFTKTLCSLLMAQVLYENGEQTKASAQLSSAKERVSQLGSPMLEYMCSIKEAQFALDREPGDAGTEEQGLEALRRSMELGRKHGYLNLFPWWQPSVIGRLCAKALAKGIEADYVQDLIRTHQLFPDDPPFDIEDWPWPVKIYTLGNFELLKDGKPLQFSGKVQKKPLLMLKALIARGGKDVREDHLADLLWPDADGDQAHSAFTTTLFRLRRLIGSEKAIEVLEGKATLNPRYVWVDAWAFERTFSRAEDLWKNRTFPTV